MKRRREEAEEEGDNGGGKSSSSVSSEWFYDFVNYGQIKEIESRFASSTDRNKLMKEYEEAFTFIADKILNETVVMINHQPHRFCEVEFYFIGGNHQDTFTHGDPIQNSLGNWYFHKTGTGYKGGFYKGLDISFWWISIGRS